MTWQMYIAISVVFYSFSTIIQKFIFQSEKIDPVAFAIFFQIVTGLIIGIFTVVTNSFVLPKLTPLLFNLAVMVTLNTAGTILVFKSLQKIEASEFTVIFSSRVLFTILASSLILRESLTPLQFTGTILIITGIIIVSLKKTKLVLNTHELMAVLAAICIGIVNTNDRYLLRSFMPLPYVSISLLIPAVLTAIIFREQTKKISLFSRLQVFKICIFGLFVAISATTFFIALQQGHNSSQVASLALISVIITVILSIYILGEKENMAKKLIGAAASMVGVLLLT